MSFMLCKSAVNWDFWNANKHKMVLIADLWGRHNIWQFTGPNFSLDLYNTDSGVPRRVAKAF